MTLYKGIVEPRTVPVQVKDKWYEKLIELESVIYSRIMTKIPNEQAFISKLADPSATAWSAFVSPYWQDADLIRLKQNVKIHMAGPKYINKIKKAYVEDKRFAKGVYDARFVLNSLDMFRYTLGGVGIRYETGWGALYKAVGVLTGDTRVAFYIGANEVFQPPVVNAFDESIVRFLRPALIAELTQGAVLATYAIEKNMTNLRDLVINTVNAKIAKIVNALKKPEFTTVELKLAMEDLDNDGVEELVVIARAE